MAPESRRELFFTPSAKVRASRFEDVFEVRARDTRTNGGSSPPCGVPRYREMTSSTLLSPICTDGRVIGERR
jgi:hypothetical protein